MLASLDTFVDVIKQEIINPILWFLFPLAGFLFVIGVLQMIINGDSPEGRATGMRHVIWSIVGMVIMASAFTIIKIAQSIFP
ncbi:MAG TPA: hypothetical protein VJB56_01740 [Candidatus Paceibacterota bacterium]